MAHRSTTIATNALCTRLVLCLSTILRRERMTKTHNGYSVCMCMCMPFLPIHSLQLTIHCIRRALTHTHTYSITQRTLDNWITNSIASCNFELIGHFFRYCSMQWAHWQEPVLWLIHKCTHILRRFKQRILSNYFKVFGPFRAHGHIETQQSVGG